MKNGGGGHFHEDEELAEMLNQMFGAGVGGFSTGGFATGSQNRASKTAVQEFEVTLEDLYKGKQVKMMSKRKVVCSHCKGYHLPVMFADLKGWWEGWC
jgi:DnaJ homolog subfamily A member 2